MSIRALLLVAVAAAAAGAQTPGPPLAPVDNTAVAAAIARIRADNAWTLQQQVSICQIPAPPFKEEARAAELRARFEQHGLANVRIDAEGNVLGERRGSGGGPTVVLSAHLDTVFPEGTDVTVTSEGTTYRAPGIGDDCRGLAVILAVARALNLSRVTFPGTILFVGTVGEEGPGNLRGVRALFRSPPMKIDAFISVDGTGLGLTTRAVGSMRYLVEFKGPGGHSYGAFGMPNPIHAMGRAVAVISDFQVPAEPRTTFNVGIVSGGTSVNTISPLGAMQVDMRSEDPEALAALDVRFKRAVQDAVTAENARWPNARAESRVAVDIKDMGVRPASSPGDTTRIAQVALAAGKALGFTPETGAGSTDANIPMSMGIPAITLDGGGEGRGAHSLGESYDDGREGWKGPQWVLMTTVMLAGLAARQSIVP